MTWIRNNWPLMLVLAAIAALNVVNESRWRADDKADRVADVSSCVRANVRSAVTAAEEQNTADFLRTVDFAALADEKEAFSRGIILRLAAPKGYEGLAARYDMVDMRIVGDGPLAHYELSPSATALIQKGCDEAFG